MITLAVVIATILSDPEERAAELAVEKVSLQTLFQRAYIASNHIPDLPSTQGVLTGDLFASMREGLRLSIPGAVRSG